MRKAADGCYEKAGVSHRAVPDAVAVLDSVIACVKQSSGVRRAINSALGIVPSKYIINPDMLDPQSSVFPGLLIPTFGDPNVLKQIP